MTSISQEECREFIKNHVFKLEPIKYRQKHPKWPGRVGIEFEMFPIKYQRGQEALPQPLPLWRTKPNSHCLTDILQKVGQDLGWMPTLDPETAHITSFQTQHQENITFEPGGQIEFSTLPYPCLADAVSRVRTIQSGIQKHFAPLNWHTFQMGITPWHSPAEIDLQMQKPRYIAMDKYFKTISPYGQQMMRQTMTVQICLDFGNCPTTLAQRYLASQLLAPFAAATFAHSRYMGCQDTGRDGYRTLVWRHVDPSRCGFPKLDQIIQQRTRDACVDAYLDFSLRSQVIYLPQHQNQTPQPPLTTSEWLTSGYQGTPPTLTDYQHSLTLLFPEVRPKGFLELRSIDAQSPAWQFVPAAYYCGLLYHEPAIQSCLELLIPYAHQLDKLMERASYGLEDPFMAQISKALFQIALEGFTGLPSCFRGAGIEQACLRFYEQFTSQNRTPSSDVKEAVKAAGRNFPSFDIMQSLDEKWCG
ncbi:MAG: glutamate-cysteine ligase family protein [Zetaproteobacteria bacterium]|nr:glutamate-cysteine ligase family protein [Zetaproteobacteria bacterium]